MGDTYGPRYSAEPEPISVVSALRASIAIAGGCMTLEELATRVEQASADQQDELLGEAFTVLSPDTGDKPRVSFARFHRLLDARAYESAAVTLVPDGCVWTLDGGYRMAMDSAEIGPEPTGGEMMRAIARGEGETPALALTAAALRAFAASAIPTQRAETENTGSVHG